MKKELSKIIWPTKAEATKYALTAFSVVAFVSLFCYLVDTGVMILTKLLLG